MRRANEHSVPWPALLLVLAMVAAPAAFAASPAVAAASPAAGAGTATFELSPCNRTYRMRNAGLAPVTQGAMTISLRSPKNHLTLASHRLELTPRGDGTHDALFVADFSGAGDLVADVDVAGVTSQLADRVRIPQQERRVEARVRLARGTAEGGGTAYEMTPLELPEHVVVDVDSQLANRFATLCDTLTLMPGMAFDCDALRGALSRARVPLPEPGETYLLPPECLTDDLRTRLDAYLAPTPSRRP